jgi:hypothetical protein
VELAIEKTGELDLVKIMLGARAGKVLARKSKATLGEKGECPLVDRKGEFHFK